MQWGVEGLEGVKRNGLDPSEIMLWGDLKEEGGGSGAIGVMVGGGCWRGCESVWMWTLG